ncbi:MAG: lactate utilization protein [Rhodospirillales bacterium]|nr:lactate utilization protein [Rhodospirillales bacterium]
MSDARETILGSIRRALDRREPADVAAAAVAARLTNPKANVIPERGRSQGTDALERFVFEAERVNATTERVADLASVPERVRAYLQAANLPAVVKVAPDPDLAAIPWDREPLLQIATGKADDHDAVSLTGSFAGVAESGTLVLLSGPESPTTLNFLPDYHVAILFVDRIVGSYEDTWARLRARAGAGVMPRVVNWITGPSRTADIEQTLLLGAHGPRRLHIILVDGASSSAETS